MSQQLPLTNKELLGSNWYHCDRRTFADGYACFLVPVNQQSILGRSRDRSNIQDRNFADIPLVIAFPESDVLWTEPRDLTLIDGALYFTNKVGDRIKVPTAGLRVFWLDGTVRAVQKPDRLIGSAISIKPHDEETP